MKNQEKNLGVIIVQSKNWVHTGKEIRMNRKEWKKLGYTRRVGQCQQYFYKFNYKMETGKKRWVIGPIQSNVFTPLQMFINS